MFPLRCNISGISGKLTWCDGRKYVGRFKNNLQHGEGEYVVPGSGGNTVFKGIWKNGKLHGLGSARCVALAIPFHSSLSFFIVYSSLWPLGYYNLYHLELLIRVQKLLLLCQMLVGMFFNLIHRYPNGDLYEGFFKDGLKDGHGILKEGKFLSSSCIYVGQWCQNKRQGYGVLDNEKEGWCLPV